MCFTKTLCYFFNFTLFHDSTSLFIHFFYLYIITSYFYKIDNLLYIVDVPGYGYAAVSNKIEKPPEHFEEICASVAEQGSPHIIQQLLKRAENKKGHSHLQHRLFEIPYYCGIVQTLYLPANPPDFGFQCRGYAVYPATRITALQT